MPQRCQSQFHSRGGVFPRLHLHPCGDVKRRLPGLVPPLQPVRVLVQNLFHSRNVTGPGRIKERIVVGHRGKEHNQRQAQRNDEDGHGNEEASDDAAIQRDVLQIKEELERIREQVENLE